MEIRETQIEDILVASPQLMKQTFRLAEEPILIGRQIIVPSGRLDMLYAYHSDLLLIELKVAEFQKKFIKQVLDYKSDLIGFQNQGKLVKGNIIPFLMLPKVRSEENKSAIARSGVSLQEYDPEDVLRYFYSEKLRPITSFSELKPIDIGIWNIHLINKFIYFLKETNSLKALQSLVGGSPKTLYNKIKFASELGLVNWSPSTDFIALSKMGEEYVDAKDVYYEESLSEDQAKIIKKHVIDDPYSSSVTIGIASIVECVFSLARTIYPVPIKHLEEYFATYSGKMYDWQTDKAKSHGAKMYSNYSIDLGLMAKTESSVYITPEGFKFVIQMQLHKSLKLMNCLNV